MFDENKVIDLVQNYGAYVLKDRLKQMNEYYLVGNMQEFKRSVVRLYRLLNGKDYSEFTYSSFKEIGEAMGFSFPAQSSRESIKMQLMELKYVYEPRIPTGTFIDFVGGLNRDDFVVLGAGTGVGKTTWLLTIAKKLMRMKKDVLYIDWEAQANKPLTRLINSIELSEKDQEIWKSNPVIFVSVPFLREPQSVIERFFIWMNAVLDNWRSQRVRLIPDNVKEYPDVIIIDYLYDLPPGKPTLLRVG